MFSRRSGIESEFDKPQRQGPLEQYWGANAADAEIPYFEEQNFRLILFGCTGFGIIRHSLQAREEMSVDGKSLLCLVRGKCDMEEMIC